MQQFSTFSSHGTHKLISKIWGHTKNIFFADMAKNRCNFDTFMPDSYCYIGCFNFLFDNLREKRSVLLTKYQILHVLKILAALWINRILELCSFHQ